MFNSQIEKLMNSSMHSQFVIKRQQKKDAREMQEIKDREKLLKEDVKKKPGDDPFEEYITMRVKRAQLVWTYEEHKKKIAEVKELIIKTREKIADMKGDEEKGSYMYYRAQRMQTPSSLAVF